MTGDGKLLKLTCLAGLFAGIAVIGVGIVTAMADMADIDAWMTALEGLASTIFGVRAAILANVPSNTAKIRKKALIGGVGALAVGAYLAFSGRVVTVAQLACAAIVVVIFLLALILSQRIVKEQLRK